MHLLRRLLPLLLLLFAATPAAGDTLSECQCLDCLKLFRLSAQAERDAYADRWVKAQKAFQSEIDSYNQNPASYTAGGKILFCELWSTLGDEIGVVREIEITKIQTKIFGNARHCLPPASGSTDPATCEVEPWSTLMNEINAPCPQIHLAILAHELVHVQDCQANKEKLYETQVSSKSCNETFKNKPAPSPERFMIYAEAAFATEVNAHDIETRVESLLQNELVKLCRPQDYSTTMSSNYKDAADFLQRARDYQYSK